MKHFKVEQDLVSFYTWIKTHLASFKPAAQSTAPLRQKLLALKWQGKQAQSYQIIPLLAAAGSHRSGSIHNDSLGGELSWSRETFPDDPDSMMLRFKCREELVAIFKGRRVRVGIGEQIFELGKVDRHGTAENLVPSGLDLNLDIKIDIPQRERDCHHHA